MKGWPQVHRLTHIRTLVAQEGQLNEHAAAPFPFSVGTPQLVLLRVRMDHHTGNCTLQGLVENAQLALDPATELDMCFCALGEHFQAEVMLEGVVAEEREGVVNFLPVSLVVFHLFHYLVASPKLVEENPLRGVCDIMRGVHCRKGRGDDWHQVLLVGKACLRIPGLLAHNSGHALHDLTKHDWLRPIPLIIGSKKPINELAEAVVWVKLTNPGYQQCPGNATKKAQHIGVYTSPLGPALDEAKRLSKGILVRHQLQDPIGDSVAVYAPNTLVIHIPQHFVILHCFLKIFPIIQRPHQASEQQINADTPKLQLDDRSVRARNRDAVRHMWILLQLLQEDSEEGLPRHVRRCDAKGVYVAARLHHAKPVGAHCHDLRRHAGFDALCATLLRYPLGDDALKLLEHLLALRKALGSLPWEVDLELLLQHLAGQHLCLRGLLRSNRMSDAEPRWFFGIRSRARSSGGGVLTCPSSCT
mmetsp:Transcript_68012/g.162348  ORF Transcript_68012/g.162348 Transcript_68012/m.162348 type:complete len:473 (+) Transcript_68012:268-1686(+)